MRTDVVKIDFAIGDYKRDDNAMRIRDAYGVFAQKLSLQRMKPQFGIVRVLLKLVQHIGEVADQIPMLPQEPFAALPMCSQDNAHNDCDRTNNEHRH